MEDVERIEKGVGHVMVGWGLQVFVGGGTVGF